MSWARDQVEFLIDLYKKNELLYDRNNVYYTNKDARTNALALITKKLQKLRPGSTVIEVKLKLWALRTQYNRTITTRKRRGRSCVKPPIIFWAEDKLSFLKSFIGPKIRANKHREEEQSMEMEEMWLEESFENEIEHDNISNESLSASSYQKIEPIILTNRLAQTLVPAQMLTDNKPISTDSATVSSDHILVKIVPAQTTAKKKIISTTSLTACSEQVLSKTLQTTLVSPIVQNNEKPFKTKILDEPTAEASDEEWGLFTKFMETEMRSIKCLKRRRRLKRKMLEFIFKAQEEEEDEQ